VGDDDSKAAAAATAAPAPAGVSAGRGLLFITGAKLWFMVAGYVIQFALPRVLSEAAFGVWIAVMALISPVNNVMVTATIQGVSKLVSERDGRSGAATRAALAMQAVLGGGVALAFFLGAPLVARAQADTGLVLPLRLAAGVALFYSFYAVFVGAANGARAFHKQAGLDATFSTLRAALVVAGAVVLHSTAGAVGGFVAAAAAILVVAMNVVGFGEAGERVAPRALWRFFAGVALYLAIVNLLMFVDSILLKPMVTRALATTLPEAAAVEAANVAEAHYGAAQTIARIPYQLILAVTFVIFPLMSRATFDRDAERTRGYVRATMRYSLVVVALLGVCLGARPQAVMRVFYKAEYAVGSPALMVLVGGYVCFSLFNIAGTIINGAGRTVPTAVIGFVTLLACAGGNYGAITWALATGRDPLVWAAVATTSAMAFGLVLSAVYLVRAFGAFLPVLSVARTAAAAAAGIAVGRVWPTTGFLGGKLGTLLSCAAIGSTFLAIAVATGELRPSELRKLRKA
jgi:stage V sporulation protein B